LILSFFLKEWLKDVLKPNGRALDVGSGSGYLVAAFYEMMEKQGKVVGIEHMQGLVDDSISNLRRNYEKELENGDIIVKCGDGRLGYKESAPYDAIHVGAGRKKMFFTDFCRCRKDSLGSSRPTCPRRSNDNPSGPFRLAGYKARN
jgi:protein-L-isoaspartate(D-aspartate) O-methyltransferase